ncbi:MAG: hypothetical protein KTR31_18280 [Myxococcales bacterium]|nr:hypothetical protein [Myxococcales bacterium]
MRAFLSSFVMIGLAACGGQVDHPACRGSSGVPTLQIGHGLGQFAHIPNRGDMTLVHGPQGGRHLELGLLATFLSADELVSGTISASLTGTVKQTERVERWMDFRCDPVAEGLVSVGNRLILDDDTKGVFDGTVADITVTVRDLDGVLVSASKLVDVRDVVP